MCKSSFLLVLILIFTRNYTPAYANDLNMNHVHITTEKEAEQTHSINKLSSGEFVVSGSLLESPCILNTSEIYMTDFTRGNNKISLAKCMFGQSVYINCDDNFRCKTVSDSKDSYKYTHTEIYTKTPQKDQGCVLLQVAYE